MAVAIVCTVGFLSYLFIEGNVYWMLAMATGIGSVVAAPFGVLTVRKASTQRLRFAIGLTTITLGALTLARTFIF